MNFTIIKEGLELDDLGKVGMKAVATSGMYDENDPGSIIYDIPGTGYLSALHGLEAVGFIKIIKAQLTEISSIDHILQLTQSVRMLQGGSLQLYVNVDGHAFEFSELELMNSRALRMRLLRLKVTIPIKPEDWQSLLNAWFEMAEDIHELSEEEEIIEVVLNYLRSCTAYKERDKALGKYTILYDPELAESMIKKQALDISPENVIFCQSDHFETIKTEEYTLRKIRWLMRDFLCGQSVQIRISGVKKRFWPFLIDKCEIDLDKQLAEDEDEQQDDDVEKVTIEQYAPEDEENELRNEIIAQITEITAESKKITLAANKALTDTDNRAILDVVVTRLKSKGYKESLIESEIWGMVDKKTLLHQEDGGFNYVSVPAPPQEKEEKRNTEKNKEKPLKKEKKQAALSVRELLKEIETEFGDEIPIEEILGRAETVGMDRDKAEEIIELMKRDGLLFSPSKGVVKFVR